MPLDDKIKEIRDRLERTSLGPWTLGFNRSMRSAWAIQRAGSSQVIVNLDAEKNIDLDTATNRVEDDLDFLQASRADVEWLLAEIDRLRGDKKDSQLPNEEDSLQAELIATTLERERLREVLAFYANPDTYRKPPPEAGPEAKWIGTDVGRSARRALGIDPGTTALAPD